MSGSEGRAVLLLLCGETADGVVPGSGLSMHAQIFAYKGGTKGRGCATSERGAAFKFYTLMGRYEKF